ncbi:MAG TPA: PilZ domain-containing protein [Polyangiales bacterium]
MSSDSEQDSGDQGSEQKRREARVTINKEFESFDDFIREYVTNISKTGAFVKRADPLPVGTEVNLKFTVIMDDLETIEGVGKVVRIQDDPPGMGVVFTKVSQYSQHLLERLLTKHGDSEG